MAHKLPKLKALSGHLSFSCRYYSLNWRCLEVTQNPGNAFKTEYRNGHTHNLLPYSIPHCQTMTNRDIYPEPPPDTPKIYHFYHAVPINSDLL